MSENKTKNKYKIQISLQLIIILSLVAIIALISASLYLSSAHKVSVASLGDIISAQSSSSNTLILKLTEPLPSGAQIKGINFTGVPSGTSISVSLENQTPVYSNGYPEYSFSVSGSPEPLTYYNVSSLTYEANGRTIVVPTITGEPMAIEETSWYSSSNTNSFPQPTSIPSGIVAYVPITITNTQDISTPKPFQQMIKIKESQFSGYITYNGNIANFEFFMQRGQVLPAWIESNNSGDLIIWVKIPGIPAKHSETIYLGFASQKTNLLSSSGNTGIGEAPQLSCPNPDNTVNCQTYAQYDDGSSVFNNYWNFAGTSLPSGWTSLVAGSGSVHVNNGITLDPKAKKSKVNPGDASLISNIYITSTTLVDEYITSQYTNNGQDMCLVSSASSSSFSYEADSVGFQNGALLEIENNNGGAPSPIATTNVNAPAVVSVYNNILYANYNQVASISGQILANGYLTLEVNTGTSASFTAQWLRTRAYPPNGAMPTVTFGSVQTL